jgi:hypothetical protein
MDDRIQDGADLVPFFVFEVRFPAEKDLPPLKHWKSMPTHGEWGGFYYGKYYVRFMSLIDGGAYFQLYYDSIFIEGRRISVNEKVKGKLGCFYATFIGERTGVGVLSSFEELHEPDHEKLK